MTGVDLHTLTGAYALGALSEQEALEFGRHLVRCGACAEEVRELRETAARLALAVAEVPPVGLRERVMAALPEVRQLPPVGRVTVAATHGRGRRRRVFPRLPYLAAAACLVFAAVAGGLAVDARREADREHARTVRAEQRAAALSAVLAAPDTSLSTGALRGGGSATVVVSQKLGQAAFVYQGLPRLPDQRVYELWYSRGGTMVPAGLVEADGSSGAMLLDGGPAGAAGVGVTAEPRGGSSKPTSPPLAVLPL